MTLTAAKRASPRASERGRRKLAYLIALAATALILKCTVWQHGAFQDLLVALPPGIHLVLKCTLYILVLALLHACPTPSSKLIGGHVTHLRIPCATASQHALRAAALRSRKPTLPIPSRAYMDTQRKPSLCMPAFYVCFRIASVVPFGAHKRAASAQARDNGGLYSCSQRKRQVCVGVRYKPLS